jgi:hypothetical protein
MTYNLGWREYIRRAYAKKEKKKKKKAPPVATPKASSLDPLQHHVAPVFQQLCPVSANIKK